MDLKKLAEALRSGKVQQADPNSTIGNLQSSDAYRQYTIEAQTNGQEPMPFEAFQKMLAQQRG